LRCLRTKLTSYSGAGIILRTGLTVTSVSVGDPVLITYTHCGSCESCKSGYTSYCETWEERNFGVGRLDGSKAYSYPDSEKPITSHFFSQSSLARHCVTTENSLVPLPKSCLTASLPSPGSSPEPGSPLPLPLLAPLACGIMTGAGSILNVLKPTPSSRIAIVGTGAVGLAGLMAAATLCPDGKPAQIIAVDVVNARLELAKRYGATEVINSMDLPAGETLVDALKRITGGKGVTGSIDCTGRAEVVDSLLAATSKRGMVVSVGVGRLDAHPSPTIFSTVNSGRVYTGCCMGSCYPKKFISMLIEKQREGLFPYTYLTECFNIKDFAKEAERVRSGAIVKGVVVWE